MPRPRVADPKDVVALYQRRPLLQIKQIEHELGITRARIYQILWNYGIPRDRRDNHHV